MFISILFLISFSVMSQKVTVHVVKKDKTATNDWQVLDDEYSLVFAGKDYLREDSVTFSLEANKKYFLLVSVSEAYSPETILYSFQLEDEPIMLINAKLGQGDHLFPFFTGTKAENAKITGGTSVAISDFPWQVFLLAGNFQCGGSIIDENWVVTAAHCTENDNGSAILASDMVVKVGANDPYSSSDGKNYLVSQVIVHEAYNNQTLENDIALLRINGPINFPNATPVKLISAADVLDGAAIPGVMSWVSGWGLTNVNPKVFPITLQRVQLPIVSDATASVVWGTIPSTDIMAGYRNGNKDACSGDSGGPLVVPVLGEYKLAGIVSWGSQNCNNYGAYTNVSLFDSWISTNTGIPPAFKPPPPAGDNIICEGELNSAYSINLIANATAYEWRLYPADAGVISGSSQNASVTWSIGYTGTLNVLVRVTVNNVVSDWSKLVVKIVKNTKILSQTNDTVLCASQPLTLNAVAEGFNMVYKWYQNGNLVQSDTLSRLNISSVNPGNSGDYWCDISGSCGEVVTDTIKVTVLQLTNILSVSPDVVVPFGNNVTLYVNAVGHNLTYQWEKDGIYIADGNNSQLLLQNVNAASIGLYQSVVKGTCGTKVSDSVYVYIKKDKNPNTTEVFVWPTMTSSSFNVAIYNGDSYNIRIFSTMGRLIREQLNCHFQTLIDISTLPKGFYIINVSNKNFRKSVKLIKE